MPARAASASSQRHSQLLIEGFGAGPRAVRRSVTYDCDIAWWRSTRADLRLPALPLPMLGLRVSGVTRLVDPEGRSAATARGQRGSLSFYPPATALTLASDGCAIDELTLCFGPRCPDFERLARACGRYAVARPDALTHALTAEMAEALTAVPGRRARGRDVDPLLSILLRRVQPSPSRTKVTGHSRSALLAVIAELPQRCGEALSTSELAAAVGLRPTRFIEVFKDVTGFTPHQYLLRLRIERCCLALRCSEVRMADIALMHGFSSQSHLTTVFHKVLGMTPRHYRLAHRSETTAHGSTAEGI